MKKFILCFVLFVTAVTNIKAQTAGPTSKVGWDMNDTNDVATVQSYQYKYYPDGATVGIVLTGVTCTADTTPNFFFCSAPFPSFTPGQHTITVSAANAGGESAKSALFTFTFTVSVPNAPANVRIAQ